MTSCSQTSKVRSHSASPDQANSVADPEVEEGKIEDEVENDEAVSPNAVAEARLARKLAKRARKSASGGVNKRDPMCTRYRMLLAYDGRTFHGWQKQHPPGQAPLRTVEGVLEECLRPVIGQRLKFFPSGRTDAGVSAAGQVAQFDAVLAEVTLKGLVERFNVALPPEIRCLAVSPAQKGFEAMSCRWKRYIYTISPANATHAVLNSGGCRSLNIDAMHAACISLLGTHDFASFQTKGGRTSTTRTLYWCDASADHDAVVFTLEGSGFLYNMVRIIVGTLLQVGLGEREPESMIAILHAADRERAGPTMPADGLSLDHVEYDMDHAAATP